MRAPENTSKPRKPFPKGVSNARLQILADLGTQRFKGGDPTRKLLFVFESTKHFDTFDEKKGAEPFIIMNELAFFMNSASPTKKTKLRQFVEGWAGPMTEAQAKAFDLETLVGKPVTLMVAHGSKTDGSIKPIINGATEPEEGVTVPAMRGKPVCYEIGMGEGGTFALLPGWIQKKIRESDEFTGGGAPANVEESPFNGEEQGGDDGYDPDTGLPKKF